MISKPWKMVGKILGVLFALPIIVVLVFVLANSIDRAPSPTVMEFQQAWDNRKAVEAAQNGYIYFYGFDAAIDEQPAVVGEKRIQLAKDIVQGIALDDWSLHRPEYKIEDAIAKEIKIVFDQCATINENCIEGIEKNKAWIIERSQAENIASERYAQLIAHPHWLELAPVDLSLPIPNFGLVMKAQRLAFINALAALETGETKHFVGLLDADLRFWRTVLRDTDMLITKMVAANAIKNNFLWTNYFLLSLDPVARTTATPVVVQQAFTTEEMSMRRCLIGEWMFTSRAYRVPEDEELEKLSAQLTYRFLFKQQDTVNRSAADFKKLIEAQELPPVEFEADFAAKKDQVQQPQAPQNAFSYYVRNPYNPVGKILLAIASPAYDSYAIRAKDLETFRSGLLASIEHMNNVPDAEVKYASPYKTKPFVIDQEKRSITVNGLSQGAHAQLIYVF